MEGSPQVIVRDRIPVDAEDGRDGSEQAWVIVLLCLLEQFPAHSPDPPFTAVLPIPGLHIGHFPDKLLVDFLLVRCDEVIEEAGAAQLRFN